MKRMKKVCFNSTLMLILMGLFVSCELLDNSIEKHVGTRKDSVQVALQEVASILAEIPIQNAHIKEVHGAVISSSGNGYDEEYTMRNIFASPGSGVGDSETKSRMPLALRVTPGNIFARL